MINGRDEGAECYDCEMSKLLVVDTETGGVDPLSHSLLSLGAVVWNGGTLGAQFEVLVAEEPLLVTDRALEINNIIPDQHAQVGLAPVLAVQLFLSFLTEHFNDELGQNKKIVLCGHNVGFDVGFLKRLFIITGLDYGAYFSHRCLDTSSVTRTLALASWLPASAESSDEAFRLFGVQPTISARHTALGDALATAKLLSRIVDRLSTVPATDLVQAEF